MSNESNYYYALTYFLKLLDSKSINVLVDALSVKVFLGVLSN